MKENIKHILIASVAVAFAVFVVLPLLPQAHSSVKDVVLHVRSTLAFDGGEGLGNGDAGNEGTGATEGGNTGCCGTGGFGSGEGLGNGDDDNDTDSPDTPNEPNEPTENNPQTPVDVCPNLPGDQTSVPSGMIVDAGGSCVFPTPTGHITATVGACISGTQRSVSLSWSSQDTQQTAVFANGGQYGSSATLSSPRADASGNLSLTLPTGNYGFSVAGYDGATWATLDGTLLSVDASGCTPPTIPACDSFIASPNTLTTPGNVTLTWTTTNADSVSIDNGIGPVAVDGTVVVPVSMTTNFILTATKGSEVRTCQAPVTITSDLCPNIPGDQATIPPGFVKNSAGECVPLTSIPSCDSFIASPKTLSAPGDVTLTWATTNVDSVSIDNGIGPVSEDGSITRNVSVDTTFILTVTKGTEVRTCQDSVDITTVQNPPLSCDAFTISPESGDNGDHATMTWETTNADSVSIDNGIGAVSADGSRDITIDGNRTYTLTATRGSETRTCPASVSVNQHHGGSSSSLRCVLFEASDKTINPGDAVTLHWKTSRGTKVEINHDVLETTSSSRVREGTVVVHPTEDTQYELTVSRGSSKRTCRVDVNTGGITTITNRDQQPLTSISFSNIPYTGFEAGPMLTATFYSLLTLWSLGLAYVLVVKGGTVFGFSLPFKAVAGAGMLVPPMASVVATPKKEEIHEDVLPHLTPDREAPMNLPIASVTEAVSEKVASHEVTSDLVTKLEMTAHNQNVLLSSDALRMIADKTESEEEAVDFLSEIITRAKASFPREDGWVVLNRERVMSLFPQIHSVAPVAETVVTREAVGSHTLAEALLAQNTAAAYGLLGENALAVIADAAEALDQVVRARKGETIAPDMLMRAADGVSDEKIKNAILALVTAIDGTYADETAAVRLSVIKALKALA